MKTKHFCGGFAVAGRLGLSAVMLGGLLLSSITGLAQGPPKPPAPPPPPPPSSVVHAVQGAANQAAATVTELTTDQKQKAEEAKRQFETQVKAAAEALARRVGLRVTQLNTYYSDQRKSRQASQKSLLSQKVVVKAKASGLATAQRAPVAKTSPASGDPSPRPMPGGSSQKPGSVVASAVPAPTITSLSATSGEPGDPILVTGTGFTVTTEVYFLVAPNRQEKANIGFTGETQLMVEVPLVTGIPAFSGLVLVKREDGLVSQGSTFRFTPRTVVVGYLFEDGEVITDAVLHNDGGAGKTLQGYRNGNESGFYGSHQLTSPVGFKVDDTLFPNTRLKNSWVVEDVMLGNLAQLQGKAELLEFGKGTNALKMKVHGWTIAPFFGVVSAVSYGGQILIRGPEGLSYK